MSPRWYCRPTTTLFSVARQKSHRFTLTTVTILKTKDVIQGGKTSKWEIICGCARPTFLFLRKITLTKSVDTTMLTFFFFMFFNLNSYCEGRIDRINNKSKGWIKPNWLQYYPVWLALNIFMVLQRWSSMKRRDHTERGYFFLPSSSPEENWDGVNVKKLSVSLFGSFLSFQRLTSQRKADMCGTLSSLCLINSVSSAATAGSDSKSYSHRM